MEHNLKGSIAMKRHIIRTFTPISAVAAVFWLAASVADAQTSPVFEYNFPASWNGTGGDDTGRERRR